MPEIPSERDILDLREPQGFCSSGEDYVQHPKFRQFLRILQRKGILDLEATDDDLLVQAVLDRTDLWPVIERAWKEQAILITQLSREKIPSGFDVRYKIEGMLAAKQAETRIREVLGGPVEGDNDIFQQRVSVALCRLTELASEERLQRRAHLDRATVTALRDGGYKFLWQLVGMNKEQLLAIPGIKEARAVFILEYLASQNLLPQYRALKKA